MYKVGHIPLIVNVSQNKNYEYKGGLRKNNMY